MTMRVLPVLAALALLVAGCSAPPKEPPARGTDVDGPSAETVPPDAPLVAEQLAQGRGGLQGTVRSDTGLALPGARVSLVEPGAVATTADDGRFAFSNVTPGTFRLRVELDGFGAHEASVTVAAREVRQTEVVLLPLAAAGGNYLPHAHDYWGDDTQRTIVDLEVDVTQLTNGGASVSGTQEGAFANNGIVFANTYSAGIKYRIPFPADAQPPALVYPGTERVEVTLTWDDAPPHYPKLALSYESANSTDTVVLEAHTSGQPWSIDVGPGMADNGHQLFSLWNFFIISVNDVRNAPDYRPTVVLEPLRVTVTVFKGHEAPAEPPHPLFWQNGTRLLLVDPPNATRTYTASPLNHKPVYGLPRGVIVPPGTKWLEVDVRWTYTDAAGNAVPGPELALWFNDARQHWDRFISSWDRAEGTLVAPGHMHFNLTVEPGATDAYYQQRTLWRWAPRAVEQEAPDETAPDWYRSKTTTLTIHAVKDPGADLR